MTANVENLEWKSYDKYGLPPAGKYLFKDDKGNEFVGIVRSYNGAPYWVAEDRTINTGMLIEWK